MVDNKISELYAALKLDISFKSKFIYVEELNNTDGSFLLGSFIKTQIEQNNNIILVLCHNSFGHFHSISQKLNYNLMSLKNSDQVFVIDILEKIVDENFLNLKEPLEDLYTCIKNKMTDWGHNNVCIVLENIGNLLLVDLKEVFPFINYIRSMAKSVKDTNVVCSIHNFPDSEKINQIAKCIRHYADVSIVLKDLPTGRANDVTGHLSVKRKEKHYRNSVSEYHYQLQEKGFIVFPPGCRNII